MIVEIYLGQFKAKKKLNEWINPWTDGHESKLIKIMIKISSFLIPPDKLIYAH